MVFLLLIILLFLLILSVSCGAGIGIGFFIHWIIPSIGVDIGTLIGVVSMGWSIYFLTRIMSYNPTLEEDEWEATAAEIEAVVLPSIRSRRASKRKKRP